MPWFLAAGLVFLELARVHYSAPLRPKVGGFLKLARASIPADGAYVDLCPTRTKVETLGRESFLSWSRSYDEECFEAQSQAYPRWIVRFISSRPRSEKTFVKTSKIHIQQLLVPPVTMHFSAFQHCAPYTPAVTMSVIRFLRAYIRLSVSF